MHLEPYADYVNWCCSNEYCTEFVHSFSSLASEGQSTTVQYSVVGDELTITRKFVRGWANEQIIGSSWNDMTKNYLNWPALIGSGKHPKKSMFIVCIDIEPLNAILELLEAFYIILETDTRTCHDILHQWLGGHNSLMGGHSSLVTRGT